jgi:DNA-directed RNA polymerase subunit alpha
MDVWTDGSVLPEDAVSYAAKIMKEQLSKFINFDEPVPIITKTGLDPIDPLSEEIIKNLHKSVEELELSVRSANCLKNADILKVYQLVTKTEAEMLKTKNFGRKSLNEIKTVLTEMKLSLGMKMPVGFNTPEDDIQQGE